MHYKKQWTDEGKTDFQIVQCYPDGREIPVSKTQDTYEKWVVDGGIVEEVDYVAPPVQPVPPLEHRRAIAYREAYSSYQFEAAVFDALANSNTDKIDALQVLRNVIDGEITE